MKELKMKVIDWWDEDNEKNFYNNYFIKIISQKFKVVYSDEPDFILYSIFGHEHLNYDCVRIFYTGENVRVDWNIADYGIGFEFLEFEDRYFRYPLWLLFGFDAEFKKRVEITDKSKFCSFMVSNPGAPRYTPRDMFFKKLCRYKKVDSGGRHLNNVGGTVGDRYGDFINSKKNWLKHYKFNICFENSSFAGYITEKLFNAFEAGCVPIYWGDTSLRCDLGLKQIQSFKEIDQRIPKISSHLLDCKINPKAYVNAHDFATWDELVEEVKRIDSDEKVYEVMFNEPVFLENVNFDRYVLEHQGKILRFFENIFNQEKESALRRGKGQWLERVLEDRQKPVKFFKLKKNLSYQLGQIFIEANKTWYKGGYFALPFKIFKAIKQYRKDLKDKSSVNWRKLYDK